MIDYFSLGHPLAALRSRCALVQRERMFELFMREVRPSPGDRILDLGVTPDESLPESNFFERLYPHRHNVTAASIEDARVISERFPGVRFVKVSADELPFDDGEFDVLFSSAVIEHVGDSDRQRRFIGEALRVADRFFFTTPNRWFPLEMHTLMPFVHWLPQAMHQATLRALGKPFWAQTENLNLLGAHSFARLFPPCSQLFVQSLPFAGWPANIVIYGKALRP